MPEGVASVRLDGDVAPCIRAALSRAVNTFAHEGAVSDVVEKLGGVVSDLFNES
jgi:hypothetical protein